MFTKISILSLSLFLPAHPKKRFLSFLWVTALKGKRTKSQDNKPELRTSTKQMPKFEVITLDIFSPQFNVKQILASPPKMEALAEDLCIVFYLANAPLLEKIGHPLLSLPYFLSYPSRRNFFPHNLLVCPLLEGLTLYLLYLSYFSPVVHKWLP